MIGEIIGAVITVIGIDYFLIRRRERARWQPIKDFAHAARLRIADTILDAESAGGMSLKVYEFGQANAHVSRDTISWRTFTIKESMGKLTAGLLLSGKGMVQSLEERPARIVLTPIIKTAAV